MPFNKIDYEATKNVPIPIGVGQTWQDVTASRALDTTYTNTTGRPILVNVGVYNATTAGGIVVSVTVNGVLVSESGDNSAVTTTRFTVSAVVPDGGTYSVTASTGDVISLWVELR